MNETLGTIYNLGSIDNRKEQGFAYCLDWSCCVWSKRGTGSSVERLNQFYEILKRADFIQVKLSKRLSMKPTFHLAELVTNAGRHDPRG
jgi:hypothetical protein